MSIDQIAAEALRLPPQERAVMAESLWESLTDPYKVPAHADDAEALGLAVERDRQLGVGEVQPVSHEEMMARLRRSGWSITRRSSTSSGKSATTTKDDPQGWGRHSSTSLSGRF